MHSTFAHHLIILSPLPFHSIVEWQEMISLTKTGYSSAYQSQAPFY